MILKTETDWTTLGHSTRASLEVDGHTVGEICYFRSTDLFGLSDE